jgi:hypothetical protein
VSNDPIALAKLAAAKIESNSFAATPFNDLAADTSVGRPDAPPRTLIYGPAGVGKSTFCASCEDVYVLPTEEGVNEIRVAQFKRKIESFDEYNSLVKRLLEKRHPYKAVCVDSAGALEALIITAIETRLTGSSVKVGGKVARTIADMNDDFGSGYQAIADEWRGVVRRLDELRTHRNMSVLITAHSKTENIRNLEGPDYPRYTVDLYGQKSSKVLVNWCDQVLFARQDVRVSPQNKHKVIALKGDLSLYTRQTAQWNAKTHGQLPWPDRLPLDWAVFDRLRRQVAEHGRLLPGWLETRFKTIEASIPDASRAKAREIFEHFLNNGQWHMADAVCRQAEEESGVVDLTAGDANEMANNVDHDGNGQLPPREQTDG